MAIITDEGLTLKHATDRQLFDEFLLRLKASAEVEYRVLKQDDNGNVRYDTGDYAELYVSFDDTGNLQCFQVVEKIVN